MLHLWSGSVDVMRRLARFAAICAACAIEPVFHAYGIPHPEGIGGMALNYFSTQEVNR